MSKYVYTCLLIFVQLQKDDENTPSTEEMHYAINVCQNDTMDIINVSLFIIDEILIVHQFIVGILLLYRNSLAKNDLI